MSGVRLRVGRGSARRSSDIMPRAQPRHLPIHILPCLEPSLPSTTMSLPTDRTPLLENGNGLHSEPNRSFAQRTVALLKAEDEPSWLASYKYFWFGAWINILLVFVPLSFISHHLDWDAGLRFLFSFVAIMPLAKVCDYFEACRVFNRQNFAAIG